MDSKIRQLKVFFFPFMAHGHMIPTVDLAKLFGSIRGVQTSIITTPVNAPLFSNTVQRCTDSGIDIDLKIIKFPCVEAGLPEGFENIDSVVTKGHDDDDDHGLEMATKFLVATAKLQGPLEELLKESKPDCLVAGTFLPWAIDSASKFGIPSLVFQSTSFFSLSTSAIIMSEHQPHKKVSSDSEPFLVPGLPGNIHFTRNQLPEFLKSKDENDFIRILRDSRKAEEKSFGAVVNSFHELEPDYIDYYKNVLGIRRVWCVGPLSLCNKNIEDKTWRGKETSIDENECVKWLDSKEPNSVVYICFGSIADFKSDQLIEIAMGLEASGQDFIWVVRKNCEEEKEACWLPEGFEKRMEGKGLIIRGWAPQLLILEHEAVGGFVSHCGWNSTLEGITAGVGMVTWPIAAEQFCNEKLVTQVLKIGVSVGASKWVRLVGDFVRREAIEKAVKQVMVGEKAEEMRSRAKALGQMARKAVEKDGSSYSDLNALIQDLRGCNLKLADK